MTAAQLEYHREPGRDRVLASTFKENNNQQQQQNTVNHGENPFNPIVQGMLKFIIFLPSA